MTGSSQVEVEALTHSHPLTDKQALATYH